MTSKLRKLMSFVLIITGLIVLCSCSDSADNAPEVPAVTGTFEFAVLKVGQADAIVLNTENHCVVIDCGESDDGGEVVEYLAQKGVGAIDYLFVTHFDKDHVGGVPEVLDTYAADRIITPDYEGNNDEYNDYCEAMEKQGYTPTRLTGEMSFVLDDVLFEVYPARKNSYGNDDNNFSLAVGVTHGDNRFLFAADAKSARIQELMSQTDGTYDFLKVPHHGIYNKSTKAFLERVDPEYAVITCSDKNPAENEVLNILDAVGSKTYLTSNGDVKVSSDGNDIVILQ